MADDTTDDKEITDVKPKGQHGGARRNSVGAREGAGRKAGITIRPDKDKRRNRTIAFSDTEYSRIKADANTNNKSIADYIIDGLYKTTN